MILSGEKIDMLVTSGELKITPYHKKYLDTASYELHLDGHLQRLLPNQTINPAEDALWEEVKIEEDGYILHPHEFIAGKTVEKVGLPMTIAGRLDGKTRLARLGISIFQASSFCDPGRETQFTLEIFNASNSKVILTSGMGIGSIIFERVET